MELRGTVVFSSGKHGDYDIWTLDILKQDIKQLTAEDSDNASPKWSPDGNQIVFVSNRTGTHELWLMNADGSEQKRLTQDDKWHASPSWSPDGKKLVFCANYSGNIDVYTMNVDGADLRQITNYEGMDYTPRFSPDGKTIIFTSKRTGNPDIWTYDVASAKLKQLTEYEGRDYSPVYSPDGTAIAYVCSLYNDAGDEDLEIYLMDADGRNRRRVTYHVGEDRDVSFSPCGRYLIFTSGKPQVQADRLKVIDLQHNKTEKIDYCRKLLEHEIEAYVQAYGIFAYLPMPESVLRSFYSEEFFGRERSPDWKH